MPHFRKEIILKVSTKGQNLLKDIEGLSKVPYKDSGGALTIGIGHLLTRSELTSGKILINNEMVKYSKITEQQCFILLSQDLKESEDTVSNLVKIELSQYQFDAIVIFTFNIGKNAFKNSTLLKCLNKSDINSVPLQMERWNKVNGKTIEGLIVRRKKEIKLWKGEEI